MKKIHLASIVRANYQLPLIELCKELRFAAPAGQASAGYIIVFPLFLSQDAKKKIQARFLVAFNLDFEAGRCLKKTSNLARDITVLRCSIISRKSTFKESLRHEIGSVYQFFQQINRKLILALTIDARWNFLIFDG